MTAVASRLRRLEQQTREASPSIRVFWHDQLTLCREHPRCDIEIETGSHHQDVIHLSFESPQR